jgi:putative mRNA 3-end processing factor
MSSMESRLLTLTEHGLYCPAGDFYVDPWRPVRHAVITHAHSDHARWGSQCYLSSTGNADFLKLRLGPTIDLQTLPLGESLRVKDVRVSLHPAGHIRGSCMVRVEHQGQVALVTGDFKRDPDPTCEAFEPVACDLIVTESTFGLPVFRWRDTAIVAGDINAWWCKNRSERRTSVLFAYALGKAQRLLASIDASIGPIYLHGALVNPTSLYQNQGCLLPDCRPVSEAPTGTRWHESLIIAVPSAAGSPWLRRFGEISTAMASGWMAIRGNRRRRALDRGFVLSDHADWDGLLRTVRECGAEHVWVTHGFAPILARYLSEQGVDAAPLSTAFQGETVHDESEQLAANDSEAQQAPTQQVESDLTHHKAANTSARTSSPTSGTEGHDERQGQNDSAGHGDNAPPAQVRDPGDPAGPSGIAAVPAEANRAERAP